ncbi:MAG TPA: hypothetical protein VJ777_31205 [Mycobacterium sp.]|nr:hypothetical protein [Mycobacterium sp.]
MADREAPGDFDYLFDDQADDDRSSDDAPDDELWSDLDGENVWDRVPQSTDDGTFDAFDTNTWYFKPAPTPWYRTKPAVTALIAASAAMAAIVVSGVLLVLRAPVGADDATTTVTPTAPTSAAPATVASSSAPPPPPPPPPPETSASSVDTAPDYDAPRVRPRESKEPEIGVTRTPATRSPISVAPQPRTGLSGN